MGSVRGHPRVRGVVHDVAARLPARPVRNAVDGKVLLLVAEHVTDLVALIRVGGAPTQHVLGALRPDRHGVVLAALNVLQPQQNREAVRAATLRDARLEAVGPLIAITTLRNAPSGGGAGGACDCTRSRTVQSLMSGPSAQTPRDAPPALIFDLKHQRAAARLVLVKDLRLAAIVDDPHVNRGVAGYDAVPRDRFESSAQGHRRTSSLRREARMWGSARGRSS